MHLRMTGTLLLDRPGRARRTRASADHAAAARHRLAVRRPAALRHRRAGARRRGARGVLRRAAGRRALRRGASRRRTCARSRAGAAAPIKAFLLDQRRIAGVGNIYADEALFRAGVHPLRAGRGADAARSTSACATRSARRSNAGIDARGASIDDFRHLDGARGSLPGPLPRAPPRAASRACAAARRSARSSSAGAAPTSASAASRCRARGYAARPRSSALRAARARRPRAVGG